MASRDTIVRAVAGAGVAAVALSVALTLRGGDDNEEMIRGGATDGATTQVLTASNPSWRVPTNVTWLSVSATGAAGQGATAGFGSTVAGSFDVSPGDSLQVIVADRAGGCSGVRNSTKGVWLVVAGGGGDEGGFFQDIPGGRGGSAGTANQTGEAGGPGAVAAVTASYNYGSAPPTNAPTTLTLQQVDTTLAQFSYQPRLVGLGGSGGPLSETIWLPQAPARPGGNGRSIQTTAPDQVPGPGGPTDYSFYPTQDAISRASRGYWTQYSSISYSPEAPTTGGRGGRGGCGWVGGQGGSGGAWGASGGGGGGGSSYIASNAFATSTSRNTRRDIRTSVTLSYTPDPTSTITVVKPSTTTSSTTSTTTSSTTTSTSTTTTSTTTSTTSTVPATTSTVAASAETPVASTIPTTGSYKPLSVYPVRSILKLPPGTQVRSVKVETRSRPVCRPLSDIVITLKPGTCRLQVTVVNGRKRSKVAAQFVVQPS